VGKTNAFCTSHDWGMVKKPPVKMVMTGGWFIIVLPTLLEVTKNDQKCEMLNFDEFSSINFSVC